MSNIDKNLDADSISLAQSPGVRGAPNHPLCREVGTRAAKFGLRGKKLPPLGRGRFGASDASGGRFNRQEMGIYEKEGPNGGDSYRLNDLTDPQKQQGLGLATRIAVSAFRDGAALTLYFAP